MNAKTDTDLGNTESAPRPRAEGPRSNNSSPGWSRRGAGGQRTRPPGGRNLRRGRSGPRRGGERGERGERSERGGQRRFPVSPSLEPLHIDPNLDPISITELKRKSIQELQDLAAEFEIDNLNQTRKQNIIFGLSKALSDRGHALIGDGVLEIMRDGPNYGFLRISDNSYLPGEDDVYVSPKQIQRYNLSTGDSMTGSVRPPQEDERYFALNEATEINFVPVDLGERRKKRSFENLTPLFPDERLPLEQGTGATEDLSGRMIDLVAPIGKGQRGLIVSPPKAGKTLILQNLAKAIIRNSPECYVIILLIDERPEEVTDMRRSVGAAEVVASTFDEPPTRHVQVANLVIAKAKRLTEEKKGCGYFAGFDHQIGAGLQQHCPLLGAYSVRRRGSQCAGETQTLLWRSAQYRGRRQSHHHCHRTDRHRVEDGRGHL